MKPKSMVGVDIGTGGIRAVVVDENGHLLKVSSVDYPILSPQPGWAEQDPNVILSSVHQVIRNLVTESGIDSESICGLSLSSVFHSLVAVDSHGRPVTPLIPWADTRALPQAERLKSKVNKQEFYNRTGCPIHPMYLLPKLMWLRENQQEAFARASRFLSIKDFVIHDLTGQYVADLSVASGSGLLNSRKCMWDEESLEFAGITHLRLPELVPTDTVLEILPERREALGLPKGAKLVVGAGDGVLASVGCGVIKSKQMSCTIGTSGAIRAISTEPLVDPQERTWCYHLGRERWVPGIAINNGGIVYRWVRDGLIPGETREARLRGENPYSILEGFVNEVPPGADGLVFLPFLTGERGPYYNAAARGVLFGLTLRHDRRHIARATMEGVAFRMKSVFEALHDLVGEPEEIRVTGGFTRSQTWLQIVADVLEQPLVVMEGDETTAVGAALLGQVALGLKPTLEEAVKHQRILSVVQPDPSKTELYRKMFGLFMDIYQRVTPNFAELEQLTRGR